MAFGSVNTGVNANLVIEIKEEWSTYCVTMDYDGIMSVGQHHLTGDIFEGITA